MGGVAAHDLLMVITCWRKLTPSKRGQPPSKYSTVDPVNLRQMIWRMWSCVLVWKDGTPEEVTATRIFFHYCSWFSQSGLDPLLERPKWHLVNMYMYVPNQFPLIPNKSKFIGLYSNMHIYIYISHSSILYLLASQLYNVISPIFLKSRLHSG